MNKSKKQKIVIVAVACGVLCCTVIGLLIFGITRHTEGGLVEVCWVGGKAAYVDTNQIESLEVMNEPCERPEKLVWPQEQIPLSIFAVSSEGLPLAANTDEMRVLSHAISDLNSELGFELYRLDDVLYQGGDVVVEFGGAIETGSESRKTYPGYIQHTKYSTNGYLQCCVYIRSDVVSEDRELYDVIKHELLHVPGLGHDDFPSSIMYYLTPSSWNSDNLGRRITDHDRSLLRTLYHITNN